MNEQWVCPKCKQRFDQENIPKKLINCSHSLCFKCLKDELICPIDRTRIEKRKYTIEAFHTNTQLLQSIAQFKKSEAESTQSKVWQNNSGNRQKDEFNTPIIDKYSPKEPLKSKLPSAEAIEVQVACVSPEKHNDTNRLSISPKRVRISFDTCLLHSKKADLVCLQDRCLICANCGLFGQHKLHKIIPYEQFLAQYSKVTEESFKIYEQLKDREEKLSQQTLSTFIDDTLKQRRDGEVKHIKNSIAVLIDYLKRTQKQLIADLDTAIGFKRKKLLQIDQMQYLLSKKQKYVAEIEAMSNGVDDIFNLDNIGHYIDYIDEQSPNSFIINEGEYLLVEIDNFHKQKIQNIIQQANDIQCQFTITQEMIRDGIRFNSKDIIQINGLIQQARKKIQPQKTIYNKFNNSTPHRVIPHQIPQSNSIKTDIKMSPTIKINNEDDPLLIGTNSKSGSKGSTTKQIKQHSPIQPYSTFQFEISSNQQIDTKQSTLRVNQFSINPHLSRSKHILDKKNELSQSRANKSRPKSTHNTSVEGSVLAQKNENMRRKKLDLPDKYQRIYEDLQKDKLEVLDLGGAFLGENAILTISDLFPSRARLRTAKLMNNKIGDDAFPDLLCKCRTLSSINLSYNLLSVKSLEWLQQQAEHLGELKSITLSNNKLVLRNVRERLEGLAKRGIKVSL